MIIYLNFPGFSGNFLDFPTLHRLVYFVIKKTFTSRLFSIQSKRVCYTFSVFKSQKKNFTVHKLFKTYYIFQIDFSFQILYKISLGTFCFSNLINIYKNAVCNV